MLGCEGVESCVVVVVGMGMGMGLCLCTPGTPAYSYSHHTNGRTFLPPCCCPPTQAYSVPFIKVRLPAPLPWLWSCCKASWQQRLRRQGMSAASGGHCMQVHGKIL